MEELDKPKNDVNYKDNVNYIYYKYGIKNKDDSGYLEVNDFKHLIIQARNKLKDYYVNICRRPYQEVKDKIHGYYLKFFKFNVKIEVHKISIPRSSIEIIENSKSIKEVFQFLLEEIKECARINGLFIN